MMPFARGQWAPSGAFWFYAGQRTYAIQALAVWHRGAGGRGGSRHLEIVPQGAGRGIYEYESTYRIPETYTAIIVAGVIGILLNAVVSQLERRMLRWLPYAQED